MTERILEIIKSKGLTSSRFAEMVGVQRSSISHLVSGRNKPSLEFLQKVLKAFPDINPDWLYTGQGEMRKGETGDNVKGKEPPKPVLPSGEQESAPVLGNEAGRKTGRKGNADVSRAIEKIIVLYRDHSFREYYPE